MLRWRQGSGTTEIMSMFCPRCIRGAIWGTVPRKTIPIHRVRPPTKILILFALAIRWAENLSASITMFNVCNAWDLIPAIRLCGQHKPIGTVGSDLYKPICRWICRGGNHENVGRTAHSCTRNILFTSYFMVIYGNSDFVDKSCFIMHKTHTTINKLITKFRLAMWRDRHIYAGCCHTMPIPKVIQF